MPLSVLSALARVDVDPWQEAAALARLPRGPAAQRLAALVAVLPDRPSAHRDCQLIATDLVALLPRPARPAGSLPGTSPNVGATANPRAVLYVLFIACLLGAQFIMTSRQVPSSVEGARAPASSVAPSEIQPPDTGQ